MKKNEINFIIPASSMKEALEAIAVLNAKLSPYLLSDIKQSQLDGFRRMGESGLSFVNAVYECVKVDESLIPRAYSKEEALADKDYYQFMKEVSVRLAALMDVVDMNLTLTGIELLDYSSEVYNTIKRRKESGDPVASGMFELVKQHYQRPSRKGKEEKL